MKEKFTKTLKEHLFIGIGVFVLAFGLHFFLFPNKIASGGITGLALVINHAFGFPNSIVITVGNIILFSLGFLVISGQFGVKSVYASILLSVALSIFERFFPHYSFTQNLILATIFGSVFVAMGATTVFAYDASTGGTSIIGKIIHQYFHIRLGMASFIVDAVVTVLAVFTFGVELALFGLLSVYITGFMTDKFIDGFNSRKQIFIITQNKEIIIEYILRDFDRGCTVFNGIGGYSGVPRDVLLTILDRRQFIHLRKFLKVNDPTAFMTVTETTKVFGLGFDQFH
ncbi:YitT family protein [Leptotrichia sp. OH3620_COT-345]|uniref:YitT family protein n=1 Tax=Leptotrichia sp. OH3620_COT-345 TaxID=2491048 RepID=UPI000F64EC87|nr:YitT family protein [Leptotrichia sp. OH3620_COT-345]RRD39775.1 YitT family protein [Leptotrichia sp. OH3620_COT-345]